MIDKTVSVLKEVEHRLNEPRRALRPPNGVYLRCQCVSVNEYFTRTVDRRRPYAAPGLAHSPAKREYGLIWCDSLVLVAVR